MRKTRKIPVRTYSRIVGYFEAIDNWNPGKKSEFADRKMIKFPSLKEIKGEMSIKEKDNVSL